jgi:NAD(P)-dependent dehydrogenase (short-subunit alcohol dehydrogenase family)
MMTGTAVREPALLGQTVVVIGGSSGIGLETARRARAEGAELVLAGRDPDRLKHAATELGASRTAAFDATDTAALERFFADLPVPVDHVMVTGPANLAFEVAPIRVNLIAAGFVDTPLSASLLGDDLDARRAQLAAELPIGRVVGPADIAALAVHIMINTALDGATYDIDGGEQLV